MNNKNEISILLLFLAIDADNVCFLLSIVYRFIDDTKWFPNMEMLRALSLPIFYKLIWIRKRENRWHVMCYFNTYAGVTLMIKKVARFVDSEHYTGNKSLKIQTASYPT